MKKTIVFILSALMILGLAACGSQDGGSSASAPQPTNEGSGTETAQDLSEQPEKESGESSAETPVDRFIADNDFTGKTVIPFCTSFSSGLGESGELLKEAAGTGEWLTGERFRSGASEETVKEWVESLSLE